MNLQVREGYKINSIIGEDSHQDYDECWIIAEAPMFYLVKFKDNTLPLLIIKSRIMITNNNLTKLVLTNSFSINYLKANETNFKLLEIYYTYTNENDTN